MHIGNAILCIADRGCLLLCVLQQFSPPINLLVLKILLPDVFNFLAVLFSTAFFWKRDNARPMRSWPYCFLGAFYADFQQFALAVHNVRNSAKSNRAAWCFFGQQAIKETKYGLPKYPQVMKPSVKFSCCLNDGDIYHPADGFFAVKNVIYSSRSGMKAAMLRVGQTFIWARLNRFWTRFARAFLIISAGIFCILQKL